MGFKLGETGFFRKGIPDSKPHYRFGAFSFDPVNLELRRSGRLVPLKLQPARLLKILLENAQHTVSRKALQEKIWDQGTLVEFEAGLNVCANQLRSTLGDSASASRFIETLPKRGYRFVRPVQYHKPSRRIWAWATAGVFGLLLAAAWILNPSASSDAAKLFVAPVQIADQDLSGIGNLEPYALRLALVEKLTAQDVETLQTINGASLWEEAESLQSTEFSDYTLLITLSREGEGFIADGLLAGTLKNGDIHRKTFSAGALKPDNIKTLSAEIAKWTGERFGLKIKPSAQLAASNKPDYFNAMVRARRALRLTDRESLRTSVNWFEKALAIDPGSVEAKGGKALTMALLGGSEGYPAEETYRTALSLADEIRNATGPTAKSELVRGFVFLYRDWNLAAARQALDLAAELSPGTAITHSWRAAVLAAQGEIQSAAGEAGLALSLDPLSMAVKSDYCWYLGAAGRYEEAVDACGLALEVTPGDYWSAVSLATAMEKLGRIDESMQTLGPVLDMLGQRSGNLNQASVEALKTIAQSPLNPPSRLQDLHCQIADLLAPSVEKQDFPLIEIAAFNARCGRFQEAADLLEEAKQCGQSGALFYAVDPRFEEFRAQPVANTIDMRLSLR